MSRTLVETLVGAAVLAVAVGFATYAVQNTHVETGNSYQISAVFDTVDGIAVGSEVRIGGIKVGVVDRMDLDPKSYRAKVDLVVQQGIDLPTDSTAAIVSESLLGGKYVLLSPGGADDMLKPGGQISFTQSSVNIESLIGQFMFGKSEDDGEDAAPAKAVSDDTGASSTDDALSIE